MSINWQKLRPWDGSQQSAFEELCCQLAAYEKAPEGSRFIRKGAPDAGIECYWILSNGDEWGWQAKFFPFTPGKKQWQQIDDSVKTALEKHPQLTLLFICFPIDRQDPRIDKQKWFMDKWNESVEKWKKWAKARGMSVEFLYWGEHEIIERLSREKHRGRRFFWFNEEFFSQQWFEYRLEEALDNAGPRYTPKLNVELPIARLFDGLGRTSAFYQRIKSFFGKIKKAYFRTQPQQYKLFVEQEFQTLTQCASELFSHLAQMEQIEMKPIDLESIKKSVFRAEELTWKCFEILEDKETSKIEPAVSQQKIKQQKPFSPQTKSFRERKQDFYHLFSEMNSFRAFINNHEPLLANVSNLLITGKAGMGKTHLFCDVAQQRVHTGLPTILLLGGQFSNRDPWSQISDLLGISCTKDEFLGALEASAQARGTRALFMIDALNEGEGKNIWQNHLAGMLRTLSRYPWIGVALSVRTSYETTVIPEGLIPERLIREEHYGFADHEYEATRAFFDYFDIEPTIPPLAPEFQNPLFLKLFCQGLQNEGLKKVPTGLHGITAIFEFFIGSIHKKLWKPEYLDFDPASRIIYKAIQQLAELLAEKGRKWLPREEARTAVDACLPRDRYGHSLFRHLISEGILTENRFLVGVPNIWEDGIQFAYERFTDHLIVRHLLDKHLDSMNPSQSFSSDQLLGKFLKDQNTCLMHSGLIEAFTIQLPERIHKELPELASDCADFQPVREAFVESLIWRNPSVITEATLHYINQHVVHHPDTHDQFLNALLTIASNPKHPYNADFLHCQLIRRELPERDVWWSIFLCNQYGKHGAVDHLVDWAWSEEDKSHIDNESIRLCGMALVWFLTTSQRYLRDKATKALVALLTPRLHVLRQILAEFITVNDPYVLERLFAVAYGCALRNTDNKAICELAQGVYTWIFKDNAPPPHILLRDYARGVIEYALFRGITLDIDIKNVRPTYMSEWPAEVSAKKNLWKHGANRELSIDESRAQGYLSHSIMGRGDFARYIIGTNHGYFQWSNRRLGAQTQPSRKEMYNNFVESLTERQRKAWEQYETVRENVKLYRRLSQAERIEIFTQEFTEQELQSAIKDAEKAFRRVLGKKKLKIFKEHIFPDITYPYHRGFGWGDDDYFDLRIAQDWIFNKVYELGWRAERFGHFDRWVQVDLYGHPEQPERIGKKYQWIAYHEFLARISDNFEFQRDLDLGQPSQYKGPWQIHVRDIDPSFVLCQTQRQFLRPYTHTWWFPTSYDFGENAPDDTLWLKRSDDLPALDSLIEVTNPEDGSRWFVLEAYYIWEQSPPSEEEKYTTPLREIWYMLRSYIVRKSDMDELFEWAKQQHFFGRWMPEWYEITRPVFLGEYFGMSAFQDIPYYPLDGWTEETKWGDPLPTQVVVTADQYMPEFGGRDYSVSIDDIVKIYTPSRWLAENMGLHWNGVEGCFFDKSGNLIAFDPSVRTPGPGALLIHREAFLRFLKNNSYDVLWTMLGEKLIHNKTSSPGLTELSGAYRLLDDKIQGTINPKFRS